MVTINVDYPLTGVIMNVNHHTQIMPYFDYLWEDYNTQHLAEHGVTQDEFEAVVTNPERTGTSNSSGLPIAIGYINGRTILCVYDPIDALRVYPVTAYEIEG